MKKIVCVILVASMLYAWGGTTAFMTTRKLFFETNAKEYYKAWAVGYCLGHYNIKDNKEVESMPFKSATDKKAFRENLKVENIVYAGDIEALNELKTYIDKDKNYFDKDRANHCLKLLIPSEIESYHSLDDEVKRIVKKYCKDCKVRKAYNG